jgi:6-phosphogluconate dehydrogenase
MTDRYDLGMVGLGVMGANLVLNMVDHGFTVAGYDTRPEQAAGLLSRAPAGTVGVAASLAELVEMLKTPRVIMLMVPAGKPVDAVLDILLPVLQRGDILIDGGNSHFTATNLRQEALTAEGLALLGVGISGGAAGARIGPCIMPGGDRAAYAHVRPVLEAIAARVGDDPCVAYLGPGSAGHYVKMVHNGIEYGLMELIAECYHLLKRSFGLSNAELQETFQRWNAGELNGYLLEITADIFSHSDPSTGRHLVDLILDVARQKGTGSWSVEDAMALRVPTPVIDAAVAMRDLSAQEADRARAAAILHGPSGTDQHVHETTVSQVGHSLFFAAMVTFAQGMAQLRAASDAYGYGLDLATVARIWRGGCIIRMALLDAITAAFQAQPGLTQLLLDDALAPELSLRQADVRRVVSLAIELGVPVPGLSAALGYYDAFRCGWLPANLIQAQRDYFGAHGYERSDAAGTFHTEWR